MTIKNFKKGLVLSRVEGFSLIEILVYISILVFMLVIILEVVVSIVSAERIANSTRSIDNSAVLALERITREMRLSDNIKLTSSTLGTHPGVLVLEGEDADGDPRTVEFYLSSGRIFLRENGVSTGALTEEGSEVTSLVFKRFATSTMEGIRTEMAIESGTSTYYRTETFYSSAVKR